MKVAATALNRKPTRGIRYFAPIDWSETTVRALLAGTDRWNPEQPPQLNFLSDLLPGTSKDRGRVYVAGDASLLRRTCVSVVGTRNVSEGGAARARKIARGLIQHGIVVVSGLAEGVDTEAITAAIAAGGRVIGVIGTPLDKAYPAQNASLQTAVYREHLLISQFAVGEKTWPSNFPRRNRLMAVLSDATVVIEASDTSGTLHQTAECVKQGRWVFIARSVVDDETLKWPKDFLKYDKCVPLDDVKDIIGRLTNA